MLTLESHLLPTESRHLLYCSISTRLLEAAGKVSDAPAGLGVLNTLDQAIAARCNVCYKTAPVAAKSCSLLHEFRRQSHTDEGTTVDAAPALVDSTGLRLQCGLEDLLPYRDFRALAQNVAVAEVGTTLVVEKRLKKLASTYVQLFDPAHVANIIIHAERDVASVRRVLEERGNMRDFLLLFTSLCSSDKPAQSLTTQPLHNVKIADLSTTIVDGASMYFNAARKAALYTLALLGTDNVSVEAFARRYGNYPPTNIRTVNYCNIFAQAMSGLHKSLPFLQVVKASPHHRTIPGLSITVTLAPRQIGEWLLGRHQKV